MPQNEGVRPGSPHRERDRDRIGYGHGHGHGHRPRSSATAIGHGHRPRVRVRVRFADIAILTGMHEGFFITFEGGEGTGKTTQIRMLAEHLESLGHTVVVTREPGGTPVAEAARAILLDPALQPDGMTEVFLLEAARRDHVERIVRPALDRGDVVISDRYADSSTVYQGMVRDLGEELVIQLNRLATGDLEPDLTVVFDLDPEIGVGRAQSRNESGDGSESRLDDEPAEFHRRVRAGFLRLAELHPDRVRVIDASGDSDVVFERVLAVLPGELR